PTNYTWYANGSCTGSPIASGATANQIVVRPNSNTTYCVRVQYGGGCPDATATTNVTVNRAPTACFSVSPASFCAGENVTLNPSCSQYVRSCGGSCLVACDVNADCWPFTCQSAACGHFSYWLLDLPPYFQANGPGASSLNPLNVTFPATGEYTVSFTLCDPFQQCCHTTNQRFTVTCVLSALDVQLRARRQDRSSVALSWAVNERHPEQRFHVMRHTADGWQTIHLAEGDIYSYTDRGLLPGRYIYQVSQSLPTGGVLLSNPAEVVLLPDGTHVLVEQRVRAVGEAAPILWSLPRGGLGLSLYDAAGRLLHAVSRVEAEGSYELPSPPAAGFYFLRIEAGGEAQVLRLVWQ
ncbi:MAG: hypothetical protein N3E49_09040, partial [Bacteroidia bacterium]|nr:hypothetical protein [Bacteroidia bacterium]